MKIILRKIESYENKKFSQTLKQHKDYTRVLLEITRKILSNDDSIDIKDTSLSSQAYLKCKHSKKCTFYTLRFGCSFAAVNTIKPQLL